MLTSHRLVSNEDQRRGRGGEGDIVDDRTVIFLQVMAAIAILGVLSFLIFLISRQAMRASGSGRPAGYRPQWYEFLLAAVVLVAAAVLLLWQFVPDSDAAWGESGRALTFFVIMLIIGAGGLIVFLLTMFWRVTRDKDPAPVVSPRARAAAKAEAQPKANHETPSAVRLIGLLAFAVAFLILNWAHVPVAQQQTMMVNLIYPAGLVVALVMMFDKASRAWNIKGPGETLREWLYCNVFVFLYLIAYLNLLGAVDPEAENYGGLFWDMLNVVAFLLVLWIVDRKTSRLRFLLAHAYLIALPILMSIWQGQMGVEAVEDISWWETIWPFFFLALVFFVLELIILIISSNSDAQGGGQGLATFKDVIFVILYIILLIAARPEAVA